jgi:hypothetical protein
MVHGEEERILENEEGGAGVRFARGRTGGA